MLYIKPELCLPQTSLVTKYIARDYQNIKSFEELVAFTYKCLDTAENCQTPIIQDTYMRVGYTLYAIITNRSYESLLQWKN